MTHVEPTAAVMHDSGRDAAPELAPDAVPELAPVKLGRKRDHSRDPEILQAAIDVLAETGYDRMTIEMVATRAKAGKATLYRRWASKSDLVIDAVACMKAAPGPGSTASLPDTGTLRGDLVAMIRPHSIQDNEKKLKVMAGIVSLLAHSPELAAAVNTAIVEPRVEINRRLLQRAIDRGEISADVDVEGLALISPSMVAYRTLIMKQPVDRAFLLGLIDGVVLPAVGLQAPGGERAEA
ncbi:TetR family transcriptional regulator [Frigoribacterium sp. PhB160]|uniref:TetR/AcrR family transcriptional regulator n=1 Tax=Frigoribacterium sp. PhB160 TaxID=2485192 RepID=UPI000FB3F425|nr:TetR/AcrR family transcriptional regulator [Frigoribacterium sp. PhB160]ROS58362.1 TetR family transcriptional regulator [Frigoribacterium sp. PhB160]